MGLLNKYYPQQGANLLPTKVAHPTHDCTCYLLDYPTTQLKKFFCRIKKGKGAWPFAKITEILRDMALKDNQHLNITWQYLLDYACNIIPEEARSNLSSV
eukprot:1271386-Ditylum_brightwellii.AAC.1